VWLVAALMDGVILSHWIHLQQLRKEEPAPEEISGMAKPFTRGL